MLTACAAPWSGRPAAVVHTASDGTAEGTCAWFGDAADSTLYFGTAAFWWALRRSGGDPTAVLRLPGPRRVGRFDLARERMEPPLAVGPGPGGVWDVLALREPGRLVFTTYFDAAGILDLGTGAVRWLEEAGPGLNELAAGPSGTVLASRYGGAAGGVVVLGPEGEVRAEHVLEAPPGRRVAAKSVAWDPLRREIWVNTDLLPEGGGAGGEGGIAHDARVLEMGGLERLRLVRPEVQFLAFAPDGTGYFAEQDRSRLWLRVRRPEQAAAGTLAGRRLLLDAAFPAEVDFVQEVRPAPDGSVLVTRWSGRVHRVHPDGRVETRSLPSLEEGGLYYSAVLHEGRLCATYCGGVTVVCAPAP